MIRPDSGDPVKIICGDPKAKDERAKKGSIEILWEIFGGTVNSKGFKQLSDKIGLIYGDSITLERMKAICQGLINKGFASTNIVLGIGSYTYQYVTRDTFGFAMKATCGRVNGEFVDIFKDPKTDDGTKRSAKGFLKVNDDLTLSQEVSDQEEGEGLLSVVFFDGCLENQTTLKKIRERLKTQEYRNESVQ